MKLIPRKTYLVPSKSNAGERHKVEVVFGEYFCDCIYFNLKHKNCSHINKIIAENQRTLFPLPEIENKINLIN